MPDQFGTGAGQTVLPAAPPGGEQRRTGNFVPGDGPDPPKGHEDSDPRGSLRDGR